MTLVEPQTSSNAAQSPGALLAGAAVRRAWLPPSLRAVSLAAVARGFGDGIVQRLLEPHARQTLRSESIGRRPGLATSARRTEIERAFMEQPALHDGGLPAGAPSERVQVRAASPHTLPALARSQGLAAAAAPRLRVTTTGQSTATDRLAAALAPRPVLPASSPSRIATSQPSAEPPGQPPSVADRSSEPDAATPRRAAVSGPARSAPHRPPKIEASLPPAVAPRRDGATPLEVQPQRAIERASERAAAVDRAPGELDRTTVGEHGRTTVAVIEPPPGVAGPGCAVTPAGLPVLSGRDPTNAPPTARAIETLIERTTRPMPVPGLEFRLLKSAPRDDEERAGRDTDEPGALAPRRPAAPPPAAPPLNIDAVADKVYRLLQRRERLERERKGHL